MTDVTILSYLLPPNLSFQQSREEPDKGFRGREESLEQ